MISTTIIIIIVVNSVDGIQRQSASQGPSDDRCGELEQAPRQNARQNMYNEKCIIKLIVMNKEVGANDGLTNAIPLSMHRCDEVKDDSGDEMNNNKVVVVIMDEKVNKLHK